ncbi:MAG: zinc-binding dehydrogenase [Halobacteriales archaeon]|nr:zinc-binding dehydrogenase [Halobacteriales archaeon]
MTGPDLPETMQAVGFHEHGDIDQLELLEVPVPTIEPDEVLVAVHAASLNHQDIFAVRELEHYIPSYPFWGGGDIAGEVVAIGERVADWTVGDRVVADPTITCGECKYCVRGEQSMCENYRVFGEHRHGGFAEYAAVPAENLLGVPDEVSMERAAAAPMVTGTAWRALLTRGSLEPYEDVLIVGASGGVGHLAVQIAASVANAETVYATTSSEEKADFLRDLGADHVIDYTSESFEERVRDLTDGNGVDLVYNNVGGDTWVKSMRSLANGGRLVTSGATAGPNPPTEIRLVFVRQLQILGSTAHSGIDFRRAMSHVFDGTVAPVVDATYPLEDFRDAFERMVGRDVFGKLVITPR